MTLILLHITTNYGKLITVNPLATSSNLDQLKQFAANQGLGFNSGNLNWIDNKAEIDLGAKFVYSLVDHFSIVDIPNLN